MSLRTTLLAAAALSIGASSAHALTFSFPSSGATPLTISTGGINATFSSPSGAGTFFVGKTAGLFSFYNGFGDFNSVAGDTLNISFSAPVTQAINFNFGIEDIFGLSGSDSLTVTGSNGQSATFGTTLNKLSLAEPEGTVNFLPTSAITSLTITSANPFAIANVPEPMSLSLLGAGLLGLAAIRRRA